MPLFRALAKNMAASYFGETALRFCNGSYTSVCLYSVASWSACVFLFIFAINHIFRCGQSEASLIWIWPEPLVALG